MKKFIAIALSVLFLFVLCGCGDKNNHDITSSNMNDIENSEAVSNQSNTTNTSSINNTNSTNTDIKCTHLWGQWVEKTKATCQISGLKERSCHNCNITESVAIKSLKHEESNWIIDKVADIGKDGVKYTKCVLCNKRMNEKTIPAIKENHKHKVIEWLIVKNPDCTNKGTKNAVCSCGKTIETKEISSKGHTTVIDKAVAATCTSNGLTEGSHCSVCNNVIIQQKTTDKLPHKSIIDIAEAATCTSNGLTEGSHCSVCKTTIVKQNIIDKLPHIPVTDKAVAATCTSEGLTQGSHCSVCNTVIVKQTPVAKIDHTFVNGTCNCGTIESLKFTLSSDSKYYILSGIGTYTKTDIVIPEKYNGLPVKEIAANAFHSNTAITSVKFNNSIEKIGNYAFFRCKNLAKALQFSSVLKEIGECAFKDCSNITAVEFGSSLQIIGYAAFQNCSQLKTLTIPASVNKIDKYAFKNCSSITDVYFEKTTTWTCYHSTYPASTMGEAALSYSKGACSFLVNSYSDRLWKRS